MFTIDDIKAIIQPVNDKLVAEANLAVREKEIERLYDRIFDLQSSLSACVALMAFDIEIGRMTLTETRRRVLDKARELTRGAP